MKQEKIKNSKKLYRSPEIIIYGNLREITQSLGMTSQTADAAMGSAQNTKTF